MKRCITDGMLTSFRAYLEEHEKSPATIEKYLRDVRKFAGFVHGKEVEKYQTVAYKAELLSHYAVVSANSMLASINAFFRFAGWLDLCVRQFKVQRQMFISEERELSKAEYERLVQTACSKGNDRLKLILQTVCSTGIRISELQHITVEAVVRGKAVVQSKGKTRIVFIVSDLRRQLAEYIREKKIQAGPVFITRGGKPISRTAVWREMKSLCNEARVRPSKVFPHNLRHLFARIFYSIEKDIAQLADILGHTSVNTTRIYIVSTGAEHRMRMEHMRLVIETKKDPHNTAQASREHNKHYVNNNQNNE